MLAQGNHAGRGEGRAALRGEGGERRQARGLGTALEEATALDPKLVAAHLMLASGYETQKDYDKAIERYRAVLAVSPDNAIALNNLAYALAVHKGQPAEAIGFAERAMTLTGREEPGDRRHAGVGAAPSGARPRGGRDSASAS